MQISVMADLIQMTAISLSVQKHHYPHINVFYMEPKLLEVGVNIIQIKDVAIKIFNRDRTICDVLKCENKLERKKLVDALRTQKLVFSTGYMYRFNPEIKKAIDKVKKGGLGKICSVEAHMDCKHTPDVRQWLENFPGGMMFFLGCHLIDLIYQIQGEPMEIIPLNCSTGIDSIYTEDYGMVVFKYPNGVSFAKTSDNECGGFLRRQLVICGEKGTIEIKPLEISTQGGQYTVSNECYDNTGSNWSKPWSTSQSDVYDRYDGMMRNFAELVRGKKNPYSYEYELSLYELILKSCGKDVTK